MPPCSSEPLDPHERMRLREAARHARHAYPGPVGELVATELLSWEEFGYRFGSHTLMARIVDAVLCTEPATSDDETAA